MWIGDAELADAKELAIARARGTCGELLIAG
jgi:hypothetical protein